MIQNIGSIPPGSDVGGKALGLDLLTKRGVAVPQAWVLRPEDVHELTVPSGTYAVRSSASVEDGQETSFAGTFLSRTQVDARAIPGAIAEVTQHALKTLGTTERFFIIVQKWVRAKVSGVAFSRHPTKDMPDVMVVDAIAGSNERLMSGEVGAVRAFAWSDAELIPDHFPLPRRVLIKLKEYTTQIVSMIGCAVDIEWAWDGRMLWILQARPITILPKSDADDGEEARMMHLFALRPDLVLNRNDFAESSPRPDQETLRMIHRQFRAEGPFHQAARELGLVYDAKRAEEYLQLVFGWLYSDAARQPVQMPRGLFAGMGAVLRLSAELERFARAFYGTANHADPEIIYAKATILAQFAQMQASRPIPEDIWKMRASSGVARRVWKEPKTIAALYAVIREDAKVASYTASVGPVIEMPIIITKREALDVRASVRAPNALAGEGVSPGIVQGIVIHGVEPQNLSEPRILIVSALTPEWIPFLDHNVVGVISETGSSMSHGAIQCRERGIPAVFGAKGSLSGLRDGTNVSINGKRGTIAII